MSRQLARDPKDLSGNNLIFVGRWQNGVVPLAVELVTNDGQCDELGVTDHDAGRVGAGIKLGVDLQAFSRLGGRYQLNDDLMAYGGRPRQFIVM